MKKLIALAMIAGFATVVFADDKKPAEPSCKMECCKKNNASCKDCKDCGKKAPEKKG